jgi:hypothetical protein
MKRKRTKLTREFWERDAQQKRELKELIDRYRRLIEREREARDRSGGE